MHRTNDYIIRLIRLIFAHKRLVLIVAILIVVVLVGPISYTFLSTRGERYDLSRTSINDIPFNKVGIVFGAGILPNGQPTTYLSYRIITAVKLFKAHKLNILIMTGDNSTVAHNEPLVMKDYAVKLGMPSSDVVLDDAGFNTYDSCYRAKAIFGVTNATLISQGYHLPRAMTTCLGLGIQNVGVIAIHPTRDYTVSYILRELVSTDKMVLQLIFKLKPAILGSPLPI